MYTLSSHHHKLISNNVGECEWLLSVMCAKGQLRTRHEGCSAQPPTMDAYATPLAYVISKLSIVAAPSIPGDVRFGWKMLYGTGVTWKVVEKALMDDLATFADNCKDDTFYSFEDMSQSFGPMAVEGTIFAGSIHGAPWSYNLFSGGMWHQPITLDELWFKMLCADPWRLERALRRIFRSKWSFAEHGNRLKIARALLEHHHDPITCLEKTRPSAAGWGDSSPLRTWDALELEDILKPDLVQEWLDTRESDTNAVEPDKDSNRRVSPPPVAHAPVATG